MTARYFAIRFAALAAVALVIALFPHQSAAAVTWVFDVLRVTWGHVAYLVRGHGDWTVVCPD